MPEKLAEYELQVLSMVVGKMTIREIAFAMDVDVSEIEAAFSKIILHFGAADIEESADRAVAEGLISVDIIEKNIPKVP